MNNPQQQRFNFLYEQHITNLRRQGKRPTTIGINFFNENSLLKMNSSFWLAAMTRRIKHRI